MTTTAARWYYVGQLSIWQMYFFDGTPAGWSVKRGGPGSHPFTSQSFPSAEAAAQYALEFEDGRKPTPKDWPGPRWEGNDNA